MSNWMHHHHLAVPNVSDLDLCRWLYPSYGLGPWPGYRRRHRLLRRLCGAYLWQAGLPAWWQQLLAELPLHLEKTGEKKESWLKVFTELTPTEFYTGQLSWERLRKLSLRCHSPRLGKILPDLLGEDWWKWWYTHFLHRGPESVALIISAHPWDILTMGEGAEYKTCQAPSGTYATCLPYNLCDSGMVVAYLLRLRSGGAAAVEELQQLHRWGRKRMAARVILRLLRPEPDGSGSLLVRPSGIYKAAYYGPRDLQVHLESSLSLCLSGRGMPQWVPAEQAPSNAIFAAGEGPLQAFPPIPEWLSDEWQALPYLDPPATGNLAWRSVSVVPLRRVSSLPGSWKPLRWKKLRLEGWALVPTGEGSQQTRDLLPGNLLPLSPS